MKIRLLLLISIIFPITLGAVAVEQSNYWLVVVSQHSKLTHLSQKQVMSLFLGRTQFLPTGSRVKTFDFPINSKTRANFYLSLTGKNIADIDAYWARLKYSGRASPPQVLENGEAIIKKVSSQTTALAYLPSAFSGNLAEHGLKAVLMMERQ
jgi:hypothetical protein